MQKLFLSTVLYEQIFQCRCSFSAILIFILLQVFKIAFHLQIRIFLQTKQELKFSSTVPRSGCTFEMSMFVAGEGRKKKRCRDTYIVCM